MDRWIVIPDFKYLVHMQVCEDEECTIEYSIYKYENTHELMPIILDEDFSYEPYDGGWYTVDCVDVEEAIADAPNCVTDEFVEYICECGEDDDTPDYGVVDLGDGLSTDGGTDDDNISPDED